LDDLALPKHSLFSVASEHDLSVDALIAWLALPETRERMATRESAGLTHARYVSSMNLAVAVHTLVTILRIHNTTAPHADPSDATEPATLRASIHARKAAWLLYRFSRLTPVSGKDLARARDTWSERSEPGPSDQEGGSTASAPAPSQQSLLPVATDPIQVERDAPTHSAEAAAPEPTRLNATEPAPAAPAPPAPDSIAPPNAAAANVHPHPANHTAEPTQPQPQTAAKPEPPPNRPPESIPESILTLQTPTHTPAPSDISPDPDSEPQPTPTDPATHAPSPDDLESLIAHLSSIATSLGIDISDIDELALAGPPPVSPSHASGDHATALPHDTT
jgi:hypothetical protein